MYSSYTTTLPIRNIQPFHPYDAYRTNAANAATPPTTPTATFLFSAPPVNVPMVALAVTLPVPTAVALPDAFVVVTSALEAATTVVAGAAVPGTSTAPAEVLVPVGVVKATCGTVTVVETVVAVLLPGMIAPLVSVHGTVMVV